MSFSFKWNNEVNRVNAPRKLTEWKLWTKALRTLSVIVILINYYQWPRYIYIRTKLFKLWLHSTFHCEWVKSNLDICSIMLIPSMNGDYCKVLSLLLTHEKVTPSSVHKPPHVYIQLKKKTIFIINKFLRYCSNKSGLRWPYSRINTASINRFSSRFCVYPVFISEKRN